jgi:hypothetical protein
MGTGTRPTPSFVMFTTSGSVLTLAQQRSPTVEERDDAT